MSGCTNCGKKGGCDSRKHEMLGHVHAALARLYPTRRWEERADDAAVGQGIEFARGQALAQTLAQNLKAFALYQPGQPQDFSDYVYVLCFGRQPCLLELREGLVSLQDLELNAAGETPLQEVYLRVALSTLAPFAAVQELRMELVPVKASALSGQSEPEWLLQQHLRAGVFDPILLSRYQKLAAALAEHDIKNVDFGEINEAPEGFDGGAHAALFGSPPTIANYLFYAGPTAGLAAESLWLPEDAAARNLGVTSDAAF